MKYLFYPQARNKFYNLRKLMQDNKIDYMAKTAKLSIIEKNFGRAVTFLGEKMFLLTHVL